MLMMLLRLSLVEHITKVAIGENLKTPKLGNFLEELFWNGDDKNQTAASGKVGEKNLCLSVCLLFKMRKLIYVWWYIIQ